MQIESLNNHNWFVLKTKSNLEKRVAEHLSKIGWDVFVPSITVIRQWSDRKKKLSVPLISCFVFVRCTKIDLQYLYGEYGVLNILKFENQPATIKDYEIENLKILINQSEGREFNFKNASIESGQLVKVVEGPFMGLLGESVMMNGKHRVKLKVKTLKTECLINVSISDVKLVEDKVA